jgi:hypothetical protein
MSETAGGGNDNRQPHSTKSITLRDRRAISSALAQCFSSG